MNLLSIRFSPRRSLAVACLGVAILFAGASAAQAGPLSAGNVIITDDGVTAVAGVNAAITYTPGGVAGAWTLDIKATTTHFSIEAIFGESNQPGNALSATISTTQTTVNQNRTADGTPTNGGSIGSDGKAHTLSITFSDAGFSMPKGSTLLITSSGTIKFTNGTAKTTKSDTGTFQSAYDVANGLFGVSTLLTLQSRSSTGTSPNSGSYATEPETAKVARIGDFSLTNQSVTTLKNSVANFSGTTSAQAVPEPATMTLLGIGLVGMAGYGWRRRRQQANAQV